MNKHDHTPLYQYEDEHISVRIGKSVKGDGAFIAIDGNVQLGFTKDQYEDMLLPLLKAIIEERTDGTFKFYKCQNDDYRLQSHSLMLVMNYKTGVTLQNHAIKALNIISLCS